MPPPMYVVYRPHDANGSGAPVYADGRAPGQVPTTDEPGLPPEQQVPAPPEPIRLEVPPPPPDESYVWRPGYWHWNDSAYSWVAGMWVNPPADGYAFVAPAVFSRAGRWYYRPCYWRDARIGHHGRGHHGGYGGHVHGHKSHHGQAHHGQAHRGAVPSMSPTPGPVRVDAPPSPAPVRVDAPPSSPRVRVDAPPSGTMRNPDLSRHPDYRGTRAGRPVFGDDVRQTPRVRPSPYPTDRSGAIVLSPGPRRVIVLRDPPRTVVGPYTPTPSPAPIYRRRVDPPTHRVHVPTPRVYSPSVHAPTPVYTPSRVYSPTPVYTPSRVYSPTPVHTPSRVYSPTPVYTPSRVYTPMHGSPRVQHAPTPVYTPRVSSPPPSTTPRVSSPAPSAAPSSSRRR